MGQGPEPQSRCNRPFSKKEESNLERRTRGLTVLLFDLREGGGGGEDDYIALAPSASQTRRLEKSG